MISHYFSAGVYAKEIRIPIGGIVVQHKHKYDHLSVLASGSIELMVDGVKSFIHAPTCIVIEAEKHHGIRALTDVVWYCIHATEHTDFEKIDEEVRIKEDYRNIRNLVASLEIK